MRDTYNTKNVQLLNFNKFLLLIRVYANNNPMLLIIDLLHAISLQIYKIQFVKSGKKYGKVIKNK
jgi:hypothetical protein